MDEIETQRLRFRLFSPADLDQLALIFSDARVMKYISPYRAVTREETRVALESMIKHWERHGYGRWAVVHRASNRVIGYGGLRCFDGTPELVYLLARPHWHCGYATEIATGCLEFGFMQRRFERIIALTKPDHWVSRRIMEKMGMSYERDANFFNIDCVLYGMSRSTYLSRVLAAYAADAAGNLTSTALK